MISLSPELLARHGAPGPRYTSYPTVMHWGAPPAADEWLAALGNALAPSGARAGIYVHIPFCQSLCTFCGCNMRLARNHALAAPYIENLLQEFSLYRSGLGIAELPIGELHLGGGSPSWLPAAALDRLLDGILTRASIATPVEFAFEADPRNTTAEQLAILRRHGFKRLSIGVQDLDTRVLEIVNRSQTLDQLQRLVDEARGLGFDSISLDLIYGLPLQTADSLRETLDQALRLQPERIAFLPYAHVPWIKPSQRRYTEADLPDGAARQELFLLGRARLADAGYVEIGLDQYALPRDPMVQALQQGRLARSFMGFSAVAFDALIGLGVSAIGDARSLYAQNEKNLQQYETRLVASELPLQRGHRLSEKDGQIRAMLWTLFSGSDAQAPQADWWRDALPALQQLAQDGLLNLTDEHVSVTAAGRGFLRRIGMALDRHLRQTAVR